MFNKIGRAGLRTGEQSLQVSSALLVSVESVFIEPAVRLGGRDGNARKKQGHLSGMQGRCKRRQLIADTACSRQSTLEQEGDVGAKLCSEGGDRSRRRGPQLSEPT